MSLLAEVFPFPFRLGTLEKSERFSLRLQEIGPFVDPHFLIFTLYGVCNLGIATAFFYVVMSRQNMSGFEILC